MTMDYYQILGVDEDASSEEIRSAYRRLVRRYHPDLGGDAEAEKFRRVQEAYETLSDPERRRQYDHTRGTRVPVRIGRPRPGGSSTNGGDPAVAAYVLFLPRSPTRKPGTLILTGRLSACGARRGFALPIGISGTSGTRKRQ
ncbi:MAG: hypothetical protein Kow00109_19210 [Acidobacteriota bacterium]